MSPAKIVLFFAMHHPDKQHESMVGERLFNIMQGVVRMHWRITTCHRAKTTYLNSFKLSPSCSLVMLFMFLLFHPIQKVWKDFGGKYLYLNLLNLSLSSLNMCLRLRFRAWAVYQSCSLWKLGSCVSPMMSRRACRAPLCSTAGAEWERAGQRQRFLKGIQSSSEFAPPTRETPYSCHTPPWDYSAG